jgi:hypothetical protein
MAFSVFCGYFTILIAMGPVLGSLMTYLSQPRTALYVGYNNGIIKLFLDSNPSQLQPSATNLSPNNRTSQLFFAKRSWVFCF